VQLPAHLTSSYLLRNRSKGRRKKSRRESRVMEAAAGTGHLFLSIKGWGAECATCAQLLTSLIACLPARRCLRLPPKPRKHVHAMRGAAPVGVLCALLVPAGGRGRGREASAGAAEVSDEDGWAYSLQSAAAPSMALARPFHSLTHSSGSSHHRCCSTVAKDRGLVGCST
jgi:hypothetical protein